MTIVATASVVPAKAGIRQPRLTRQASQWFAITGSPAFAGDDNRVSLGAGECPHYCGGSSSARGRFTVCRPRLNTASTGALVATASAGVLASITVTSAGLPTLMP